MHRVTDVDVLRSQVAAARQAGRRIGFVPTMGALHAGHLSLVRECSRLAELTVVSIFVNPTQFGPDEDLEAYPRDLEGDEDSLRALGQAAPDLVFAPAVEVMYPPGERLTTVTVDRLTDVLCGRTRPGHFDGVTTVVAKLLNLVQPDVAVFGRKDFQQLTVIRRMVADLNVPVEIVGVHTAREPDGVAMSSRNAYLEAGDRLAARALSGALRAAVRAARSMRAEGRPLDPEMLREAAGVILTEELRARIDYVEVLDPDTLAPPDHSGQAPSGDGSSGAPERLLVAVAAYVGTARLIDNVVIGDEADEDRLLAATGG